MAMPRIENEKLNEVLIPESISENDRAKLLDLISTGFPAWRDRFQSLVNAAIERIRQCNPRVLMCMCAYRVVGYKLAKHHDYDECRWRSIEFIQNILVTHKSQPIALS